MSGQKISATELYLTYDSSMLSYYKEYMIGTTSSGVTSLNNFFQEPLISEITPVGSGTSPMKQLKLSLVSLSTPSTLPAQVHLRFKAKKIGTATVTLDKTKTKVTGANASNNAVYFDLSSTVSAATVTIMGTGLETITPSIPTPSVATPSVTLTYPPNSTASATLKMKLKFQGINAIPTEKKMNVEVGIGSASPYSVKTVEFTAQDNGTWTGELNLPSMSSSYYTALFIKGPKHLRKKVCDNKPTETAGGTYKCDRNGYLKITGGDNDLDFTGILMLAGDIPVQDGLISALDLAYIRQNLGNKSEDSRQRGDLNLDGIVDTQDFSMILQTLAFKYDEE
jgi:hypothetical protein